MGLLPVFLERDHDHERCLQKTLQDAERICRERRLRLTPQRQRVLAIIASSHKAVGAYDILEMMTPGGPLPAPVTVYRALEFLMAQGLVHRLASLNAYVACRHPGADHGAHFLVCRHCATVAEMSSAAVWHSIQEKAAMAEFTVATLLVEVAGVCRHCREPVGQTP
ncbi:MAG: transcriptional repressor [Magnetococcus sp. DMHC-1]|nr:transcriptional repressor [Magnetococcales bacterium]